MKQPYVFNIGFNRSGTSSLSRALNILDIRTAHYTVDGSGWLPLMKHTKQLDFFLQRNMKQNNRLFHKLDKRFKGFSDFGGEYYYRTLYRQYPNSKFIFTLRPIEDWIKSNVWMEKIDHKKDHYDTEAGEQQRILTLADHYLNYKKEIQEFFKDKPNQYLEMNICNGDGWQKLCNFLEKEIPEISFPYLNKQYLTEK